MMAMRKHLSFFRVFGKDSGGATAIEFAVLAVPFFLLFMGIIEYGLFMMTKVAVESATAQAGRAGSLGGCNVSCVQTLIANKTSNLINASNIVVTAGVVDHDSGSGGAPFSGDLCNSTPPHIGGDCSGFGWQDLNGNGSYDSGPSGAGSSVGGPGDIVEIRVALPWHVLMPFVGQYFGSHGTVLITSNTVVKNENY